MISYIITKIKYFNDKRIERIKVKYAKLNSLEREDCKHCKFCKYKHLYSRYISKEWKCTILGYKASRIRKDFSCPYCKHNDNRIVDWSNEE